jgi:hypothetical protein
MPPRNLMQHVLLSKFADDAVFSDSQGTKGGGTSGHSFSAANPYGKRADGDTRQFAH